MDLFLHQQGVDTTTPAGKALFQMMGVFAEFERAMIRERVKSGFGAGQGAGQDASTQANRRGEGRRDPGRLAHSNLLALAAAIGAAVLAASLSALVLAAIVAIDRLGPGGCGLCKCADNENCGERKKCDCAFH